MTLNPIKIALLLILLQNTKSFTFLHQDTIDTIYYETPSTRIEKIVCKSPPISDFTKNVTEIWKKLMEPYDITKDKLLNADNEYTLALKQIDAYAASLYTLNEAFENLLGEFQSVTEIDSDITHFFQIDEGTIRTAEITLYLKYKSIEATVKKFPQFDTFQSSTGNEYAIVVIELYQIIGSLQSMSYHFNNYYNTLITASINILDDNIKSIITPYNAESYKTEYEILQISNSQDPTIFIKTTEYKKRTITKQLIPIFYHNYGLENDYYLDTNTQQHGKRSINKLQIREYKKLQKCLNSLDENTHNDTLKYCNFVYNPYSDFKITATGILFNEISPITLNKINTQLSQQITSNDLPFHITFNKTIKFHDPTVGDIIITKNSPYTIEKSSFNTTYINFVKTKLSPHPIKDLSKIVEYINEQYHIIILNSTIIISFYILYLFFKTCINKLRYRSKRLRQINRQTNRILRRKQ